jgi:hypothetical protein
MSSMSVGVRAAAVVSSVGFLLYAALCVLAGHRGAGGLVIAHVTLAAHRCNHPVFPASLHPLVGLARSVLYHVRHSYTVGWLRPRVVLLRVGDPVKVAMFEQQYHGGCGQHALVPSDSRTVLMGRCGEESLHTHTHTSERSAGRHEAVTVAKGVAVPTTATMGYKAMIRHPPKSLSRLRNRSSERTRGHPHATATVPRASVRGRLTRRDTTAACCCTAMKKLRIVVPRFGAS